MAARTAGWAGLRPVTLAALMAVAAQSAAAQNQAPSDGTEPAPAAAAVSCADIGARAYEAALVLRQHAGALSSGIDPDARPEAMQLVAWLDQWTGRLRLLIEFGDMGRCFDEGDAETYRRALVIATRVGNQAREELLRPVRPPQPRNRR